MATEAQIRANRLNAQKSTGPKSKRGKDVVSQNAVKHGLCANKHVIRSESVDEYNLFRGSMIADLKPLGAMELVLAERIVSLSWRLKRAEHLQNIVIEALMDYEMEACNVYLSNARREAKDGNVELLMGHVIKRDFADSRTLDLLLSYERRIESSLYKATSEFRRMQNIRKEKQSEIEEEYRKQNTGNRMDSDLVLREAEQMSVEAEDVTAETEFAKQSQFEEEYRTQNTENRMDSDLVLRETEQMSAEAEDVPADE